MLLVLLGLEVVLMELFIIEKNRYLSSEQYFIKDFDPKKPKLKLKIEEK